MKWNFLFKWYLKNFVSTSSRSKKHPRPYQGASYIIGDLSGVSTLKYVKKTLFTLCLWTQLAVFPKTETLGTLGNLEKFGNLRAAQCQVHENYKMIFWLFLAIFRPFGQPQVDLNGCREARIAQCHSLKKNPQPNYLVHFIKRNGPWQPEKAMWKLWKKTPPQKVVFGPKVVYKSIRKHPHGSCFLSI